MSSNGNGQTGEAAASETSQQAQFNMIAQYIKDLYGLAPEGPGVDDSTINEKADLFPG